MSNENEIEWARAIVENKRWIFHTPTLMLGPVKTFFDGEGHTYALDGSGKPIEGEGVYVSPVNGEPVPGPVLELLTGHALLADPSKFIELEGREVGWYVLAQEKFAEFITAAANNAATRGIPESSGILLIISLLRTQLVALEKAAGAPGTEVFQ